MDYRLENLSPDDFEALVNELCQKVLGTGVVSFSKGQDGGRDGRFKGTANYYPSSSNPWSGKFIIQAKHTTDYNASCSDNGFHGNKKSIINKEIPKIQELKKNGEIDYYLIFANRKETGKREEARQYILEQTQIKDADIIGKETIHRWLGQNIDIVKRYDLDKFTMPFEFYDKDIREVIIIFHSTLLKNKKKFDSILERPEIEEKNRINNLDKSYYDNVLEYDLTRYRTQILDFLENHRNLEYAEYYEETAAELKRVIETKRDNFGDFKEVFDFLTKYLMEKEPEKLKRYRNTIPALFHFMYYQCDIGREK